MFDFSVLFLYVKFFYYIVILIVLWYNVQWFNLGIYKEGE